MIRVAQLLAVVFTVSFLNHVSAVGTIEVIASGTSWVTHETVIKVAAEATNKMVMQFLSHFCLSSSPLDQKQRKQVKPPRMEEVRGIYHFFT